MPNRREFLLSAAALPALGARPPAVIGLGLGNYGLRKLSTEEAIRLIAGIGYDSVELTLMDGYPTAAAKVAPEERRHIRAVLAETGMPLVSLLEQIPITGDEAAHKAHLERLRCDAQFGHDVNPGIGGIVPTVQTHLGGSSADWDKLKHQMVDRLRDWAEVGRAMKMVVSFKGHNLNLNDTSEKTLWLIRQVDSPWLRVLYDYSHYQPMGEGLGETLDRLLPYTKVISIKDGRKYPDKPGFERLLPGEGTIDYVDYYRRLIRFGFNGHTVVEISGQIHSRPGYDPVATAKRCYANIAPLMAKAGVRRPARGGNA